MKRFTGEPNKHQVTVLDRKGREVFNEEFDLNLAVIEFKKLLRERIKLQRQRQYLTLGKYTTDPAQKKVALTEDYKTLAEYGIQEHGYTLTLKDLGPQVSWRTVFIVEYAGPMIIFLLNYLIASRKALNSIQEYALILIIIHYGKRELESCFLHVFSHDTMPFKRIFINSFHYWFTCGTCISVELYYFWKNPEYSEAFQYLLIGLFCVFEFLNFMCHKTLKELRAKVEKEVKSDQYGELKMRSARGIPRGWGFDLVTCANYLWEVCVWTTFAIFVRCWSAYVFLLFSFYQMAEWALGKHRGLKKRFDGQEGRELYPKHRKAIIPFVL
mmetsp:Transcript_35896/g.32297  ORF Transcript_35896/g.32297 Transcript_35896/m.32297 type:complete len:327 (-) Transcript_35896:24-1004(-)